MKMILNKTTLALFMSLGVFLGNAKENVGVVVKAAGPSTVLANNCIPASSEVELSVNNVRTIIRGGGDFWWNGNNPKYEIPKNSNKHSLFSGSLWIGGLADDNTLKVAAMTYRQTGNDFWPGPLDSREEIIDPISGLPVPNPNYGQTDQEVCGAYNEHFRMTLEDVLSFYQNEVLPATTGSTVDADYIRPSSITNWPGNGVDGEMDEMLAPFYDFDGDGVYDPGNLDFPGYDILDNRDCKSDDILFGDETIFFVFNDRGNVHTETNSAETIGLEIRAQAFGFTTNDEINDMSFYNFKIINRSVETLNQTYFGTWVDSDIGNYIDDYVGCDVNRGLGYSYNGDENDDGALGYGLNPPAIGLDFFRGPKADNGDGVDNDFDGCVDCTFDSEGNPIPDVDLPELISMSKFVYYNNNIGGFDPNTTNPQTAPHFYNYLIGRWKNGQPMTYGENAFNPNNSITNYMFPGDTDPAFPGQTWTEESANNTPGDRRFLVSAGPFTLEPGAVNFITTGLVWARANTGGAFASVQKMRVADDKAQALFDNCFAVLNGPDAPDMDIVALDKELILTISNSASSNNYKEEYLEVDPTLISTDELEITDNTYKFEGYQIFQLANETVSASELYESDKAKLVFQVDLENYRLGTDTLVNREDPISILKNHEYDLDLDEDVPTNKTIVAANAGIKHSFRVTEDLFALGDKKLVNHKTYYFMVVAYGYNEYMVYEKDVVFDGNPLLPNMLGQKLPFKAGRRNLKVYSAFPYKNSNELVGEYGARPAMTRYQGQGNSGFATEMSTETFGAIVEANCAATADYLEDASPVNIFVINPENVSKADYMFEMLPASVTDEEVNNDATWRLIRTLASNGEADTVLSSTTIGVINEQLIPEWGLAVDVNTHGEQPWTSRSTTNGFISAEMSFADEDNNWLSYVVDIDYEDQGGSGQDWISAGTYTLAFADAESDPDFGDHGVHDAISKGVEGDHGFDIEPTFVDPNENFETVLGGAWAPHALVSAKSIYPGFDDSDFAEPEDDGEDLISFRNTPSVRVVFTSDKSKWTRVPVLETSQYSTIDNRLKMVKDRPSKDKNQNDEAGRGWSWFPGYAIDKDAGVRLNMMFGENSLLVDDNGDDMWWNPTSTFGELDFNFDNGIVVATGQVFGGMHYVYVMNTVYQGDDETANPHFQDLNDIVGDDGPTGIAKKLRIFREVNWVSIPFLTRDAELLSTDVTVDLNVAQPLREWGAGAGECAENVENNGFPKYGFNTNSIASTTYADRYSVSDPVDLVGVVPNPYYGSSFYEEGQIDHRIKITNVPPTSTISIYNVAGTLVFQTKSPDVTDDFEWNLKNQKGISIASGVYIIHVKTQTAEKTIKWFGALRPVDLDSY